MRRSCTHCQRPFTPYDFVKEESKNMEAERKALGLEGVRFFYYTCSKCHGVDIFLDLRHRPGESVEEFRQRRQELETAIRRVRAKEVNVVLVER